MINLQEFIAKLFSFIFFHNYPSPYPPFNQASKKNVKVFLKITTDSTINNDYNCLGSKVSISPRDRRVINKQVSTQTIRGVYKKLYYHSLYYILYYTKIHIYTVYLSLYVLQNVTMYLVILFVLRYTTYIQYITVWTMYIKVILEHIMYFIPIALVVALGGVLRIYIIFYK